MTQVDEHNQIHTHDHGGDHHDRPLVVLPAEQPVNRWLTPQFVLLYFVVGVMIVWILSGFYQVGVGEVAVVERLGQYEMMPGGKHAMLMEAGLHYHIPWPIDTIHIVPLQREHLLEVSDFHSSPAANAGMVKALLRQGYPKRLINAIFNPYLITGDKNILHARVAVQYQISHPLQFILAVYQPPGEAPNQAWDQVMSLLTDRELIHKLAYATVDEALYNGKTQLEQELYDPVKPNSGLQRLVTKLNLGAQVERVELKYIHWPSAVNQAFSAVLNARQQKNQDHQDAKKQYNQLVILANAQAQTILNQAQAKAASTVDEAQGEANAFGQILTQYRHNPRVITLKLLNDTLSNVMNNVERVFFVQPHQQIILSMPPPPKKVNVQSVQ
jgi:membrane protease subunit HflK